MKRSALLLTSGLGQNTGTMFVAVLSDSLLWVLTSSLSENSGGGGGSRGDGGEIGKSKNSDFGCL